MHPPPHYVALVTLTILSIVSLCHCEVFIPGCYSYKYKPPIGARNVTFCFCEHVDNEQIDIACHLGATTKDVLTTIKRVSQATGLKRIRHFYCTDVDFTQPIPRGFLSKVPPVSEVTIRACEGRLYLNDNAFEGQVQNIEILTLQRCYFPDDLVTDRNLHPAVQKLKKLKTMFYTGTNLLVLNASSFVGMNQLEHLEIGYNLLEEVTMDAFIPLAETLKTLDLAKNTFVQGNIIPQLAPLKNLELLVLVGNRIAEIEPYQFQNFTKLKRMALNQNDYWILRENAFAGLNNLEWLDLQQTFVNTTEPGAFNGLPKLKTLFLGANYIQDFEEGAFEGMPNLDYLHIGWNEIAYLRPGVFSPLKKLNRLDVSQNGKMGNITEGVFDGLDELEYLIVEDTGIENITESPFSNLKNLKQLSLARNTFLKDVAVEAFEGLGSLKFLALNDTGLSTLREGVFDPLTNIAFLDLSRNNWYCDKDIEWLVEWIQARTGYVVLVNWNVTLCSAPPELDRFYLHNLQQGFLLERGANYSNHNVSIPTDAPTTQITTQPTTTYSAFGRKVNDILQINDAPLAGNSKELVSKVIIGAAGSLLILTVIALAFVTTSHVKKNRSSIRPKARDGYQEAHDNMAADLDMESPTERESVHVTGDRSQPATIHLKDYGTVLNGKEKVK